MSLAGWSLRGQWRNSVQFSVVVSVHQIMQTTFIATIRGSQSKTTNTTEVTGTTKASLAVVKSGTFSSALANLNAIKPKSRFETKPRTDLPINEITKKLSGLDKRSSKSSRYFFGFTNFASEVIFCNEDGELTSICEWAGALALPRWLAFDRYPGFIT